MTKRDIRALFRGDDAGKLIRAAARRLHDQATARGLEKEREAQVYRYQTRPYLDVEVVQLRADPPLWRMRTAVRFISGFAGTENDGSGRVVVTEMNRRFLEPELRLACARILLQYGHVQTWEEATERMKAVTIHEQGLILLKDSERWLGERGR